jgi:2-dehydro-3-deoxygluconokinase
MTHESPHVVTLGESLMLFTSPPGTTLLHGGAVRTSFVGAESNVAIGLSRLGHSVRWLSVLGDDLFGNHILKTLRGEGVDVSRAIQSSAGPTAVLVKNRRPAMEPEIFYYRSTSAMSKASPKTFTPDAWRSAKILYLTGITPALSDGCHQLIETVIADAKQNGIEIWFDPNYRSKLWSADVAKQTLRKLISQSDVILAGESEGRLLTDQTDPKSMATELLKLGPQKIVIKSGEQGSHLFTQAGSESVAAEKIAHLIDPIGAGDAFAAGFLSATLDGLSPRDCLRRGNLLGAVVCQTDGDWEGLPTRHDLAALGSRMIESKR